MQLLYVVFACIFLTVASDKVTKLSVVQWEPCISEEDATPTPQVGTIKQIRIHANCTLRCQLRINSSVEIEVDFEPGEDTNTLTPEMSGVIGPLEIPFPSRNDVCDSVFTPKGQSCPLKKGILYTYRRAMPVKDEYPPIVVDIKWKFITDKKHVAICFVIKSELIM